MDKKLLVKICGITAEKAARDVICLGPDMLGLVFVPSSPRKVTLKEAQAVAKAAQQARVKIVAVFQNQPLEEVLQIVALLKPDYIQLHGDETAEFCRQMPVKVIKAIRLKPEAAETRKIMEKYKPIVDLFLIDRPCQGRGDVVDLKQVEELAKVYPVLLAGGLALENISLVLAQVRDSILGVDVSSGVETSPGVKDLKKVVEFINKVKSL